ncbi:hypothetical protein QJU93_09980 [Pasteurella skyensis]|uniref:Uncharacterized protein n=1 Tax=Phocoenobacter skyensis TaxID=97481 RepID=A0AAJ6NBC2_9PAST|nr:hypothetical protein [Pasteurella skyensis]MDP8173683.1 hypothetical protein [Pasteurella skyensis]MDP8178051.1 hypothetical protein [Pasteurella skyensis]
MMIESINLNWIITAIIIPYCIFLWRSILAVQKDLLDFKVECSKEYLTRTEASTLKDDFRSILSEFKKDLDKRLTRIEDKITK